MWSKEDLDVYFKAFTLGVFSSGGDGDGTLAVKKHYDKNDYYYKEVADAFGEYKLPRYGWPDKSDIKWVVIKDIYKRHDHYDKNYVLFTDESNENFVICQYEEGMAFSKFDDIFMVI